MIEDRDYQKKIVDKTLSLIAGGKDSIMIESPVGSGKTIMGLLVIQALMEEHGGDLSINWVANRRHLLKQVAEVNADFFGFNVNYVSMFDKNPPKADVIILDEAHHEATVSSANIFARSANRYTLGLSATPLRTDHMKLSFQSTVKECGIARLINDEYLSPFVQHVIPEWTPASVAKIYQSDPAGWGKSLVFFRTIKECYEFQELVNQEDFVCDVITGYTNQDAQIIEFESGATKVVANVQVLTEGFDLPDLQTVFVRDASRLPTTQMAGRGLRKAEGKSHCNVVQSQQTRYSFMKAAKPLDTLILTDGVWLSVGGNSWRIDDALKETAQRIAARGELLIPSFSKKPKGDIKAHYRAHRREWQNGLRFLTDPEDQMRYLEVVAEDGRTKVVLSVADCWVDHFGNTAEARNVMALAEQGAGSTYDWYLCALAWETRFNDYPNALRCIEKALKSSNSSYRRSQYQAVYNRIMANVVP